MEILNVHLYPDYDGTDRIRRFVIELHSPLFVSPRRIGLDVDGPVGQPVLKFIDQARPEDR